MPNSTACSRPAARSCSPASRRATATVSPACPSAPRKPRRRLWRAALRAGPAPAPGAAASSRGALERVVDVHAFDPATLRAAARPGGLHRRAGHAARSCSRTGSAGPTARSRRPRTPIEVPWLWRQYAFRGYVALQRVDGALLEGRLPPAIFYNLLRQRPARPPDVAPMAEPARSATFRCSRSGSSRCPASVCRCTSSRSATRA